jgi:hypothetical protein
MCAYFHQNPFSVEASSKVDIPAWGRRRGVLLSTNCLLVLPSKVLLAERRTGTTLSSLHRTVEPASKATSSGNLVEPGGCSGHSCLSCCAFKQGGHSGTSGQSSSRLPIANDGTTPPNVRLLLSALSKGRGWLAGRNVPSCGAAEARALTTGVASRRFSADAFLMSVDALPGLKSVRSLVRF